MCFHWIVVNLRCNHLCGFIFVQFDVIVHCFFNHVYLCFSLCLQYNIAIASQSGFISWKLCRYRGPKKHSADPTTGKLYRCVPCEGWCGVTV